ncbi:siderophore ABC transporter substrate-binding protein [Pseudomonas sp. ABC1]|uniref:siderophore ABC transporter substrate-binding protein n=1 Tax=Pseudomonas sp. ABC1 TaxID=2748080 RepID=UPI0015C3F1FA|nr:siderophore ABC transporter substrate-binding protein [Pseudomonas sp. ABC1]QLF93401.1 siderophore ABC transporter substrate-binding protein [Pseudomonas sp. ABC1]
MSRRLLTLLALLAVLVLVWGVGGRFLANDLSGEAPAVEAAEQQLVRHAQGETAVPLHPARVGVFDLGALDILDALGVDAYGVAGDDFPEYLARYRDARYVRLGTLFEPDYEAVHRAAPDLVITGGRSSARYAPLAQMVPTIDMPADDAHPVAQTLANLQLLAKVFDREARAQALAIEVTEAVEALRAKTADRGRGLIVLVSGGKLSAYGPGSRFGVLHTDFGVPVAAEGLTVSLHGEAIGSEFILKTNPDWLFVIDRDAAIGQAGAARQVLDNPLVRQTTAWRTGQVMYLEPVNWYLVGGGVQALQAMIRQVDEGYERAR